MKKIAFLYFSMNVIYINILNNLNFENDFLFITSNLNYLNPNSNINKIEIPNSNFNVLNKFIFRKGLFQYLNKHKPSIVIVTDIFLGEFFQTLFYKLKNPKVKFILYSEVQRLPKNIIVNFFGFILINILFKYFISKKVSKIACFTTDGVDFYKNFLPKRKKDIVLVPPIIDTSKFYPIKNRKYLKNNILNILIVARMVEYKNYFDLLKALKYLKDEKNFKNFKLNILGEGPLKNNIKQYIIENNLSNNVVFLKQVDCEKIRYYYYENDVLILPSFNEAIGMVVPEAMACGTSTIISDTVGAKTYVRNNKYGLIFKTGDCRDLADKILFMYNRKKLELFGLQASINIENNFSENNVNGYFKKVL